MPWSEWMQSEPLFNSAVTAYGLSESGYGGDTIIGETPEPFNDYAYDDTPDAAYATAASEVWTHRPESHLYPPNYTTTLARWDEYVQKDPTPPTSAPWVGKASVQQVQRLVWCSTAEAGVGDPTYRDWMPAELWQMEEGVDYAVRPDRTGSEDDAYVEYEQGVEPTLAGWQASISYRLTGYESGSVYVPTPPGSVQVKLVPGATSPGTEPATDPVEVAPVIIDPSEGLLLAEASDPAPTDPSESVGLDFTDALASSLSGASEFLIATTINSSAAFMGEGQMAFRSGIYEWDTLAHATGTLQVRALVRLPRWRYWIPGGPKPLRQRQRDDGLALSAVRWRRGTSRQASPRWSGYL